MSISKIKTGSITTDAITEAKVADNAIENEHLNANVITGQSELAEAAAGTDVLLVYDASAGTLKKIQKSNVSLAVPTFSSVNPTSLLTGDGTGNYTIVVTGTKFDTNATFKLRTSGGTDIDMDSVSRDSSTQLTGTVAKNTANLTNANEPFGIVITNGSGTQVVATGQINVDALPVYVTAAGSLGTGAGGSSVSFSVNATDPESAGNVTFELQSGTLPPGLSLTNTAAEGGTAIISGTATNPSSNTTYNFTLRAVDAASNTSSRAFSITVNRLFTSTSFTSSGTFSVPSGITSLNAVLVVAGGGSGGVSGNGGNGGGGAGGLIYFPEYPVTPGGTITVTVGSGAGSVNSPNRGCVGQDSKFGSPGDPGLGQGGVLTAKGGGGGGVSSPGIISGQSGGSGGGAGEAPNQFGTAIQPTQPGNSGAYGFGNPGGDYLGGGYFGSGGGGAGAAGTPGGGPGGASGRGHGGIGKAYTIADGTTPTYYAGGGGSSAAPSATESSGNGGQGGGGTGAGGDLNRPGAPGANAQANKGGGGGGSNTGAPNGPVSGQGGSGIVIVRY